MVNYSYLHGGCPQSSGRFGRIFWFLSHVHTSCDQEHWLGMAPCNLQSSQPPNARLHIVPFTAVLTCFTPLCIGYSTRSMVSVLLCSHFGACQQSRCTLPWNMIPSWNSNKLGAHFLLFCRNSKQGCQIAHHYNLVFCYDKMGFSQKWHFCSPQFFGGRISSCKRCLVTVHQWSSLAQWGARERLQNAWIAQGQRSDDAPVTRETWPVKVTLQQ